MSNSALSSAKRRRTVGANDSPINSTSQVQESMQNNRPVSLQQAIHILNNRTLLLEQTVSESLGKNTENVTSMMNTNHLDEGKIQEMVNNMFQSHFTEFNHRYEILATEIMSLKQIIMKLQSYTLDINKTMAKERIQLLSDIPSKTGISVIELKDDLNLREDIANMADASLFEDTVSTIHHETVKDQNSVQIPEEVDGGVEGEREEEEEVEVEVEGEHTEN